MNQIAELLNTKKIMKKIDKLLSEYEKLCNKLVSIFCEKQELDFDFWIANNIGGVASFSNSYFFSIDDILIDLKGDKPKGLIMQWQDEGLDFDEPYINYYSYANGLRHKDLQK